MLPPNSPPPAAVRAPAAEATPVKHLSTTDISEPDALMVCYVILFAPVSLDVTNKKHLDWWHPHVHVLIFL